MIKIRQSEIEKQTSEIEQLTLVLDEYQNFWTENPNEIFTKLSEEQISLLIYSILYNQVQNGGFIQLIFNNYTPWIFKSPLADSLRDWGANKTATLIDDISDYCIEISSVMKRDSLDDLSNAYKLYPDFNKFDEQFYQEDGFKEVAEYVSNNIIDFVEVVQ